MGFLEGQNQGVDPVTGDVVYGEIPRLPTLFRDDGHEPYTHHRATPFLLRERHCSPNILLLTPALAFRLCTPNQKTMKTRNKNETILNKCNKHEN